MLTELGVALDQSGVVLPAGADLSQVETVEELQKLIASVAPAGSRATVAQPPDSDLKSEEIEVPEPVANLGRRLLSLGQRFLYGGVFDVGVSGKSFIPQNENFLVIANHTSHLDMGLIKVVLRDQDQQLPPQAARGGLIRAPRQR